MAGIDQNQYGYYNRNQNNYGSYQTQNQSQSYNQNRYYERPTYRSLPMIAGKIINNEMDIVPSEVPSDGSIGLYLTNDLSTVYAKTHGGDGLIHTNVYTLLKDNQNQEEVKDPVEILMQKIDALSEQVSNLVENGIPSPKQQVQRKKTNSNKEDGNDE